MGINTLLGHVGQIRQFIKMCLVGSIGAMVQIISYNLLRNSLSSFYATEVAILLAVITNFYTHSLLTFNDKEFQYYNLMTRKGAFFISFSLLTMFLQGQWMKLGVWYFGRSVLIENLTMFVGMGWGSIANFLFYQRIIWPDSKKMSSKA